MEYRRLPRGTEQFSVLGLGFGSIGDSSDEEIENVVRAALDSGINYFDLCCGESRAFAPFGRAVAERRDQAHFQLHLGAVYDGNGDYGWSRDMDEIKRTFAWELKALHTDYVDMGFVHCVDDWEDYGDVTAKDGVLSYLLSLKEQGIVRHMGFSSHTPEVADRLLDLGVMDMMMFSINPAYDFEHGDECGKGTSGERAKLFRRCEADGVGISVMKPFHAGKLLSANTSPFRQALTRYQCLQYALDRPGVLTVLPGVRGMQDLRELLGFFGASRDERDYSVLGGLTAENVSGNCVYCSHCQPCPAGIDVGLVNKYYDLALAGDKIAAGHYDKLTVKADACLHCGHCDDRCPFGVAQSDRMTEIAGYFQK